MIESASARPPLLLTDSQPLSPPTPSFFATTIVNSPLKFSLGKVACIQHQRSLQLCTFFAALLEFHLSKYHSMGIARRVDREFFESLKHRVDL